MLPDNSKQQPYAIAKLEEAEQAIQQAVKELPALRKRMEKYRNAKIMRTKLKANEIYSDLQQQRRRVLTALNTATLALQEMELPDLAAYSVKLSRSIQAFNLMTPDYSKLCAVLSDYLSKLPVGTAAATDASVIGHLMASVKMGYYPTDMEHVEYLEHGIGFPAGVKVNLLDPCCGSGTALRTLAEGKECSTYGIELDRHHAEEALTRLDRVGFGSYFHSRVSNGAFHLMLLNPPYLSVMTEGGNNTRSEKRFLVNTLPHLLLGGLLIYIVPYYRLTPDICRILCDNLDDLTVWKFTGDAFRQFKQVAVLGTRKKRQDGSNLISGLAALALDPESIPELSELPESRYTLPQTEKQVDLFKGAEFNAIELEEQLSRSTSFSRLFEKNRLDSGVKRPLLPLNLGQVGLIGGSGLINGLVECDTPHIIKGRIVKENIVNQEKNLNSRGDLTSTTVYETHSNKMIFNLLTPQGFLSLSDYGGNGNSGGADTSSCLPLGRVIITADARRTLTNVDINTAITRHRSGDWGNVSKPDQRANNRALKTGERILSSYTSRSGKPFWVITEADRSSTTVLLPEDY